MISNIFETFHRISDTSKVTKERVEQHGKHKMGQGGYQKVRARIVRIKRSLFVANFFVTVANK